MLEVNQIHVSYGNLRIVNGISMSINKGETISLIGTNGAGKTTLVHAISRLTEIQSGQIVFNGIDLSHCKTEKAVEAGIVLVPEGRKLFPRMTVKENLEMGAYIKRAKPRMKENFELVYSVFPELKTCEKEPAGNLSGGQQQMVAIGRGLMADPMLLILDEPSVGLSPMMTSRVFAAVKKISKTGVSVLVTEQNVNDVLTMADSAYVIQQGRILLEGSAQEIANNPEIKKIYMGM